MGFYEKMRDGSAKKLITKYGAAMTLRRTSGGTYNPNAGSISGATTTDYPCRGVIQEYRAGEIDGMSVLFGDKKILVSASGLAIVPESEDLLIIGSNTYSVINNSPLSPGGVDVIYTVQVRGQ